jgi:hypothetical protein
MKRIKFIANVAKRVGKGIIDGLLPNVTNSIKKEQSQFVNEKPKICVDWVRLSTAILAFVGIVLTLLGKIDIKKVYEILDLWENLGI